MKKILLIIFVIPFTLFSFNKTPIVSAQENYSAEFKTAFNSYTTAFERYNTAHEEYLLAKSQYLKFRTLTAKTTAQEKGADMLRKRDEAISAYLNALKLRLKDDKLKIDSSKKSTLTSELDGEIAWYNTHLQSISTSDSFETLTAKSDEASARYKDEDRLIYETLYIISDGRVADYQERLNGLYSQTKDLYVSIKDVEKDGYKLSDHKKEIIERWLAETQIRVDKANDYRLNAAKIAEKIITGKKNEPLYNSTLDELGKSQNAMLEATSFLKEIVREISSKD